MSKYRYITISNQSPVFSKICQYCDKKIVEENLKKNGGTLNYSGIIFDSDYLILCLEGIAPIGFNSIIELEDSLYINQIAVQNNKKHQGIGTELMKIAIKNGDDKNKSISAHVRDYNIASNSMFQKLGFDIIEPGYNALYILKVNKKIPSK